MAQFLILNDNVKPWLIDRAEAITGFLTSSTATSFVIVNSIGLTIINTAIVAIVSGFIGSLVAHYTKKLITKIEKKYGKKQR